MQLFKSRFKDLTAADLQRACLSNNPTGKYVNIHFVFYTTHKRLLASITYNKFFGVFTASVDYDYAGYCAEWRPLAGERAKFFTFKKAYRYLAAQLFLIKFNKSIPL